MINEFRGLSQMEIANRIVKDQDLKLDIIDKMQKYGGSFVVALSQCILRADSQNLRKLVDAFSEYFMQYHPSEWGRK